MSPQEAPAPRRTKIVATIGPGSESERMIEALIRAGVDVFRLNFSHGSSRIHSAVAQLIREASERQQRYVGVLVDLQGPKIRIDSFQGEGVQLAAGAPFRLDPSIGASDGDETGVGYAYAALPDSLKVDDILLLDDGRIRLRVREVRGARVDCVVVTGGRLGSRKGINRLGGGIAAPALTEKDIADIRTLGHINPDFVAVSFVSQTEDIEHARQLLDEQGLKADIIAKIERAEVVHNDDVLAGILEASNGLMVARGDLGVEVGDAELIGIQKELISRARRANRLVITATQMMESMINSSMPTRAEVFDVANAVLDGTDAVMLSAETAVGKYPVEVVRAMADAALGAERHPVARNSRYRFDRRFQSAQETIAMAAIYAANHYPRVRGIACLTESGNTPRLMSRLSSGLPIFALSTRFETLRKLTLCRGVVPLYFHAGTEEGSEVERRALEFLRDLGHVQPGDSLLLSRGEALGEPGSTNMMKIITLGADD